MILGIGTDIVSVKRLQTNLGKYGDRFAQRILAEREFDQYQRSARAANFLAKRFAAKEAMAKAIGTGFRDGISLGHIAVTNDELGKPQIVCTGHALEAIARMGVTACHLSISDEQDYAIAFVTLEGNTP